MGGRGRRRRGGERRKICHVVKGPGSSNPKDRAVQREYIEYLKRSESYAQDAKKNPEQEDEVEKSGSESDDDFTTLISRKKTTQMTIVPCSSMPSTGQVDARIDIKPPPQPTTTSSDAPLRVASSKPVMTRTITAKDHTPQIKKISFAINRAKVPIIADLIPQIKSKKKEEEEVSESESEPELLVDSKVTDTIKVTKSMPRLKFSLPEKFHNDTSIEMRRINERFYEFSWSYFDIDRVPTNLDTIINKSVLNAFEKLQIRDDIRAHPVDVDLMADFFFKMRDVRDELVADFTNMNLFEDEKIFVLKPAVQKTVPLRAFLRMLSDPVYSVEQLRDWLHRLDWRVVQTNRTDLDDTTEADNKIESIDCETMSSPLEFNGIGGDESPENSITQPPISLYEGILDLRGPDAYHHPPISVLVGHKPTPAMFPSERHYCPDRLINLVYYYSSNDFERVPVPPTERPIVFLLESLIERAHEGRVIPVGAEIFFVCYGNDLPSCVTGVDVNEVDDQ